jgi:Galactose-binding domain-like
MKKRANKINQIIDFGQKLFKISQLQKQDNNNFLRGFPMKYRSLLCFLFVFLTFALSVTVKADTEINPNYIYVYKGIPTANRSISLGDPTNWSTQVIDRQGKSESGAISIKPVDFQAGGDALQISWHKKSSQGNFSIYGSPIDLSKYKDLVYLTIDMRVDEKPKGDLRVGMDCGYPCRADMKINKMIKGMKKGVWFSLPIPLNCFKGENFDLSKINGPFTISSSEPAVLSITNVRLEKFAEGETGCQEKH